MSCDNTRNNHVNRERKTNYIFNINDMKQY